MRYVLDSSSIYTLVGGRKAAYLSRNYTCDLARYELGNILINENRIRKKIIPEEQRSLLEFVARALGLMLFIDIKGSEHEILKIANQRGLTFYDASYAYIAKKLGAILVTEDQKLARKITGYVKVINAAELSGFGSFKTLKPFTKGEELDEH